VRFVSRILIGVAATAMVAIAAPVAANATSTTSTASHDDSDWGPYFSSDHKAEAVGSVTVDRKPYKFWYWKTFFVKDKVCKKDRHGDRHCAIITKKVKKHVWTWKFQNFYRVDSTLTNHKWWGGTKCAWETFKIVSTGGDTSFQRYSNCDRHPEHFSFSGKDAAHIFVDVSRGDRHHPTGYHSGWESVYHAAA
jgi:hypothetical protein